MTHHAHLRASSVAVLLTLTLAACGGEDTGSAGHGSSPATSSPATSSPATSSPATSSPADDSATPLTASGDAVSAEHNSADVVFAQEMIVHHRGAMEMAEMAAQRAGSQEVKDLADTISEAQGPEIELMTSWLKAWGEPVEAAGGGHGAHGAHGGGMAMDMPADVPGMMSEEQMTRLGAARSGDFDRMFLEMMIAHHQGAVDMARTEQVEGVSAEARELAAAIESAQAGEIELMQQMVAGL